MAVPANTNRTFNSNIVRESLANDLNMIAPRDVPFQMAIDRGHAISAVKHDWPRDDLRAANADNAHEQGDDTAATAVVNPTRPVNHTQILKEGIVTAESLEAVDVAGGGEKMARQVVKTTMQLKRDLEARLLDNEASVVAAPGTPGEMASVPAFIETNIQLGATGAAGGFNAGTGIVDAYTPGTARPWTETMLKTGVKQAFDQGGNPTAVYVSTTKAQKFSGFTGEAEHRREAKSDRKPLVVIGAANHYVHEFGDIAIVPDRFMDVNGAPAGSHVVGIDPDYIDLKWLRKFKESDLAKTGDARKKQIVGECTVEVGNEAAHFSINALNDA